MRMAERRKLKEYVREQLEARIQATLQSISEQTGMKTRRRDVIGVLVAQYNQAMQLFEVGIYRTSLSEKDFAARVSIMLELIPELSAVPEA